LEKEQRRARALEKEQRRAGADKVVEWGPRVIELEREEFGYHMRGPMTVECTESSVLERLLDLNNFLLAISFYIPAKLGF
jgi:hypothetical protein